MRHDGEAPPVSRCTTWVLSSSDPKMDPEVTRCSALSVARICKLNLGVVNLVAFNGNLFEEMSI